MQLRSSDVGAKSSLTDAMKNKKHVVMLNVETDVVIGPCPKLAQKEGVIYTGSAGEMNLEQSWNYTALPKPWE